MEKKKEENRKWRTSLGRRRGWWEWVNGALESSAEEQSEISSNFPLILLFVLTITMDGCNDKTGEKADLGLASSSIFTSCELRKRFSEGFHFKELLVMIFQMMMKRKRQMGGSGGWWMIVDYRVCPPAWTNISCIEDPIISASVQAIHPQRDNCFHLIGLKFLEKRKPAKDRSDSKLAREQCLCFSGRNLSDCQLS